MNKFNNSYIIKNACKVNALSKKMAYIVNKEFNKKISFCRNIRVIKNIELSKNIKLGKNIELNKNIEDIKISKNILNIRKNDFTGEDSNKWEYMTKKNLEESKINKIFNKIWISRFKKFRYSINISKIYMSDFIMFNKNYKLTLKLIEKILPYIKFKKIDSNTIQIDKWTFTNINFIMNSNRDKPNYNILWSNNELNSNEFVKTEEDKFIVIKTMIQIMNETPDEFINFNSYKIMSYWYINAIKQDFRKNFL